MQAELGVDDDKTSDRWVKSLQDVCEHAVANNLMFPTSHSEMPVLKRPAATKAKKAMTQSAHIRKRPAMKKHAMKSPAVVKKVLLKRPAASTLPAARTNKDQGPDRRGAFEQGQAWQVEQTQQAQA